MTPPETNEPERPIAHETVSPDSPLQYNTTHTLTEIEAAGSFTTTDRHSNHGNDDAVEHPAKIQPSATIEDRHQIAWWNPLILNSLSLLGLTSVFLAMFGAVLTLYFYSRANHGIADQVSSNHYTWKYGPVALIVVIAGIWHQVDYYCKILAPWQSLLHGSKSVDQTVLLDYISPPAPVACFQAIQNHHWAVGASTAGVLLLDLALVFSTAFLVLLPVQHTELDNGIGISSKFVNATTRYDESAPAMIVWGNLKHQLSLPFGTTEGLAFLTPALGDDGQDSEVLKFDVPAFVPRFECQEAPVSVNISLNNGGLSVDVTVTTPACDLFTDFIKGGDVLHEAMPPRILTATGADVSLCGNGQQTDPDFLPWPFVVTDIRYWQTFGPSQNGTVNVTAWYAELANATAIVCQPSYALRNTSVSIDVSSREVLDVQILDESSRQDSDQIEGFNNTDLSNGMSRALEPLFQVLQPSWSALDLTVQNNDDAMFSCVNAE